MAEFEPSDKSAPNHINRYAHRSDFSEATVYGIVDESLICHVGFKLEDDDPGDWPVVIPMACGRIDNRIFLHGHLQSRLLKALSDQTRVCLTFTSIGALMIARSAFHNDFRYRCAMILGTASLIPQTDLPKKLEALKAITNHAFKSVGGDRWADSRPPTETELKSTRVVEVVIEMASAKIADDKGPTDELKDLEDPQVRDGVWAGELLRTEAWDKAQTTGDKVKAPVPDYVTRLMAKR